mgnify:CR=1 FL=1
MDRGGKGGVQYVQFGLQGGNRWLGTLHIAGIATVTAPTHFAVAVDGGAIRKVIRQRDAPEYQQTTVVARGTTEATVRHRHGLAISWNLISRGGCFYRDGARSLRVPALQLHRQQ